METKLAGAGSSARVTGAYAGRRRQHLDFDTTQEHAAEHTTSDLAFRGVLADRATAVWRGMIRVDPGAQHTDAFQESRNLLLSNRAHADAIPGLEIEADDVRCTHAAAVAQVDPEQLYYLRSRGLPEPQAKRLVIDGFLQELPSAPRRAPSATACPPRSTAGSPRSSASCPGRPDRRSPAADGDPGDVDVRRGHDQREVARLRRLELPGHRLAGWGRHVDAQAQRLKELGLVRDDPQAHLVPFSVFEDRRPARRRSATDHPNRRHRRLRATGATRMGLAPAILPPALLGRA